MQKIIYDSSVDALVALSKRLSIHEENHHLSSEEFFNNYKKGTMNDSEEFVEWSNDYQHFLSLKSELENLVSHAA